MTHLSNLRKNIGSQLKRMRTKHGFTQQVIASYLGITRSVYTSKEIGAAFPTIDQLLKLATLYKRPVSDFFPFHPSSIDHAQMIQHLKDENSKLRNKNKELKKEVSLLTIKLKGKS